MLKFYGVILVSLLTSSCAFHEPKRYDFPNLGLTVIRMPPNRLTAGYCGAEETDDGSPLFPKDKLIGCWQPDKDTILVDECHPGVLLHELAHADGWPRDLVDDISWDPNCR